MLLNETVTIGDQEVNVSARRADGGSRISITPDNGAMLPNLLATCKTWCQETINEISGTTAHAHLEDSRVIVNVMGCDFAQERIKSRVGTLPEVLRRMAGRPNPGEQNQATEPAFAGNTS